jgi:hypothetical protein
MRLPALLTLATLSILGLWAADQCSPLPPEEHLTAPVRGCSITQKASPDLHWYVWVWTEKANGEKWKQLYSGRNPEELSKAMKDCNEWLSCVEKAQRKVAKAAP